MLVKMGQDGILHTAGMLDVSSSIFDGDAVSTAQAWFNSMGKSLYTVGPLCLPPKQARVAQPEVGTFLERMQQEFGSKSVIYVRFASCSQLSFR
jgi:hypothetical protein